MASVAEGAMSKPGPLLIVILLAASSAASAQPADAPDGGPPAPQPPPGSAHATFMSTNAMAWDVLIDRQPACATPCSVWVAPASFVTLRTHERQPVLLDVGYMPQGDLLVRAEPLHDGAYATGIVFTTLSGMSLVTGITLSAVGCPTDHPNLCTAGIITGVAGGVGLYASILLMRSALPRAHVGPARPYAAGTTVGLAGTF